MSPTPEESTGLDDLRSDLLGKLQALETELLSDGFDKSAVIEILRQILKIPSCKDHTTQCLLSAITFQTALFDQDEKNRDWYDKWLDILDEFDNILQPNCNKQAVINTNGVKSAIAIGKQIREKYNDEEPTARRDFIFGEVFKK